jgi:DNA-binding response OmpR family regulator
MDKLIYIDDDIDALDLYKDIFEDHFKVTTCPDPEEALALARREKFDAVLLDIHFPDTTGFELLVKLKEIPHIQKLPFFFISSENTLDNRLEAFELGTDDFISRFMEPDEVISRIKRRVQKYKEWNSKGPTKLKVGDIELDQENLILKCKGEIIPVTQIEYKIMYILVKNHLSEKPIIIPKDELIRFVWPVDPDSVFPRTLSTHLTNLRKKLNSDYVKIASIRQNGFLLKVSPAKKPRQNVKEKGPGSIS